MGYNAGGGKAQKKKNQNETNKKKEIKLIFGIFFDGTKNSRKNIEERLKYAEFRSANVLGRFAEWFIPSSIISCWDWFRLRRVVAKNDSYWKDFTNIVRLSKCMKENTNFIPIYIEGAGTKPKKLIREDYKKESNNKNESQENKRPKRKYNAKDLILGVDDEEKEANTDYYLICNDEELAAKYGLGEFGVKAKVQRACDEIIREVKRYFTENDINLNSDFKFEFYVFGYSRGAASARCFCSNMENKSVCKTNIDFTIKDYIKTYGLDHAVSIAKGVAQTSVLTFGLDKLLSAPNSIQNVVGGVEGSVGPIGNYFKVKKALEHENEIKLCLLECLKEKFRFENSLNFTIKFLGLFDTISAYGTNFKDDVNELSLNKINSKVDNVYQVCAGDESRLNYELTDVSSYGKNNYVIIPGSHNDIGGESSKLYSLLSFDLMLRKVPKNIIDSSKVKEYEFPINSARKIDGIMHDNLENNKLLSKFFDEVKNNSKYYIVSDSQIKKNKIDNYSKLLDDYNTTMKELIQKKEELIEVERDFTLLTRYQNSKDAEQNCIKRYNDIKNDINETNNKIKVIEQKIDKTVGIIKKVTQDILSERFDPYITRNVISDN